MAEEAKKITKSMLIIKSDLNSLKGVEQFLKNREWQLFSTNQMKDAILFLTRNKPSFVLITVDHSNPKIKKLPKIISSTFPCCVMVYAEKSATASFKQLMDSGVEYKINPPVTGPAIERAVNKFIRDQEQAGKTAQNNNGGMGADPSSKGNFEFKVEVKTGEKQAGFVSIKGEGEGASLNGANPEDGNLAQRLMAQLEGESFDPLSLAIANNSSQGNTSGTAGFLQGSNSKSSQGSGNVINLQKDPHKKGSSESSNPQFSGMNAPGINPQFRGPKNSDPNSPDFQGQNDQGFDPQYQQGRKAQSFDPMSQGKIEGSDSHNSQFSGNEAEGIDSVSKERKSLGSYYNPQEAKEGSELSVGKNKNKNKTGDPNQPNQSTDDAGDFYIPKPIANGEQVQPANTKNKQGSAPIIGTEVDDENDVRNRQRSSHVLHLRKDGHFQEDSIFVKGVSKAIDETVIVGDGSIKQILEDNSHMACIIVESNRFSGYLVAALGKDKKIDGQFVELIRLKLIKFLKDNGEAIENESNLQIKVKRVDFEGWALEYAQFLRKSVHKGDEVAMAFFPFANAQTPVGESAAATMVSIKTEDIQTDTPLDFNMYLYLTSNKKYILYTPEGGKFLREQKDRLIRQGMIKMHIQKGDVQNLSKFKAQNHLNSLIKEYEQKPRTQKKKKAA